MLHFVILETLTADFHTQLFQLFLALIAKKVVATFYLHCLGQRIKYRNPEVRNTAQQFLSTTRLYCSIEVFESFLI